MKKVKLVGKFIMYTVIALVIVKSIIEMIMLLPLLFPPSAKEVVKKFYSNKEMFEESKVELINSQMDYIVLEIRDRELYIIFYDENENRVDRTISLVESEIYKNTIALMRKHGIQSINKDGGNVEIFMADFGQEIVWIENMEHFEWGHSIYKQEQLKDNWYYIKLN